MKFSPRNKKLNSIPLIKNKLRLNLVVRKLKVLTSKFS
jgi:hypothetical protein